MSKNFWRRSLSAAALSGAALFFANSASASPFVVSYEGEAAGVQNTTATFSVKGVEGFDSLPVHSFPQSFTTDFGTSGTGSTITGAYQAESSKGIQINAANSAGGAGGNGNYIVAFQDRPYSLTLSSNVSGGVNYFGFWLSALDGGNVVTLYDRGGESLTFNTWDVIHAVNKSANPSLYYGDPNRPFLGQDKTEPFIFLNFFDTTGTFSKVVFTQQGGGGYESDNQTVGHYKKMGSGTFVPLADSFITASSVPEPATWAMMLSGFAGLGFLGYRRNKMATVAA